MSDNSIPQTGQQRERENNKETQQDKTPRGPLQTSHGVTTIEENVVAKIAVAGGISVQKGETQAAVDVTVVVEYGVSIVEVANAIRRNIIEQIEGTTGLEVVEVNIDVTDVHLPDDDSTSADSADLK